MLVCLIKAIKIFDIFAEPISLKFKGQEKFTTVIGGLLSLLGLFLVIYISYDLLNQIIYHLNPVSSSLNSFYPNAPLINLNSTDSAFSFQFSDLNGNPFYDESYFNFDLKLIKQNRNSKKSDLIEFVELDNCSNHFDYFNQKNSDLSNYFVLNRLNYALCIKNQSIVIQGSFISDNYTFLTFALNRCNNQTFQGKCKRIEEINQLINGAKLRFYYREYYNDFQNYTFPFKPYLNTISSKIDPYTVQEINYYLKLSNLSTDYGFIKEYFDYQNIVGGDYSTNFVNIKNQSDDNILKIYFKSSNNVLTLKRVFKKFRDLTSMLGGILSVYLFTGGLLINYFKTYKMYEVILNSIYDFKLADHNHEDEGLLKRKSTSSDVIFKHIKMRKSLYDKAKEIQSSPLRAHNSPKTSAKKLARTYKESSDLINMIPIQEEKRGSNEANNYFSERDNLSSKSNNSCNETIVKEFTPNFEIVSKLIKQEPKLENRKKKATFKSASFHEISRNETKSYRGLKNTQSVTSSPLKINYDMIVDEIYLNPQNFSCRNVFENNRKSNSKMKSSVASMHSKYLTKRILKIELLKQFERRQNELNKNEKLDISYSMIIGILCCVRFSKKVGNMESIVKLTYEKMKTYLDYIEIIKLLQQFQKMKEIILSPVQNQLFSFSSNTIVTFDKEKKAVEFLNGKTFDHSKIKIEEMFDYYEKVMGGLKSNIDEKILSNLDLGLKKCFEETSEKVKFINNN